KKDVEHGDREDYRDHGRKGTPNRDFFRRFGSTEEWLFVDGRFRGQVVQGASALSSIPSQRGPNANLERLGAPVVNLSIFCLFLTASAASACAQCSFTLNPSSADAPSGSSTGSFAITATRSDCARSATSNTSWLTVTFGQTGTGNGSVGYRV